MPMRLYPSPGYVFEIHFHAVKNEPLNFKNIAIILYFKTWYYIWPILAEYLLSINPATHHTCNGYPVDQVMMPHLPDRLLFRPEGTSNWMTPLLCLTWLFFQFPPMIHRIFLFFFFFFKFLPRTWPNIMYFVDKFLLNNFK